MAEDAKESAGRRARKPGPALVSGEVYEDYLRGVAKAQTLPPTLPGLSCPPWTMPAAACPPAGGVESAAGFPTVPSPHCTKTIPGLNCPVGTLPIVQCLPDEPAGATIPIVGCPKTVPGVTCPVPTVPILACLPEHAEADVIAPRPLMPTVLPPCSTIAGQTCPLPTLPLVSCAHDRSRTLAVVGCEYTLPGVTCPLPSVPVVRCLPQLATPAPDATLRAARAAIDHAPEAIKRYKETAGADVAALPRTLALQCRSLLIHPCPTWHHPQPTSPAYPTCGPTIPVWCCLPPTLPPPTSPAYPTCGPTIPFRCCLPPTLPPGCRTMLPFCGVQPPRPGEPAVAARAGAPVGFQPFPTIPIDRCVNTLPGVNCPVPTIPIRDCLPIQTLPVVGCPRTIPGVVCDIETIPLIRCLGDELPDPPEIKTIIPPCPTVPGVTCPIRTIPITSCLPGPGALADAKEAEVKAAPTLPVIGCPPTIPGVTCDLPTVPVVDCLELPPEPPPPPPPMTMPRVACPVTILPPECPITAIAVCPAPTLERGAGPTIVPVWCATQPAAQAARVPRTLDCRTMAATPFPYTLTCPTVEPEDPRGLAGGGAAAPITLSWSCAHVAASPQQPAAISYPGCPTMPPDCEVTHPPLCRPTRWCAPGAGPAPTEWPCGRAPLAVTIGVCPTMIGCATWGAQPPGFAAPTRACQVGVAVAGPGQPAAQAAAFTLPPCIVTIGCPTLTCPTIFSPCPTLTERCLSLPCTIVWLCPVEPEDPAQLAAARAAPITLSWQCPALGPQQQLVANQPITISIPLIYCTITFPAIPPTIYEVYCR